MEKTKLKHLLKCGILLFGISVMLFNCQKDDTLEIDKQLQTDYYKTVSLNQLPKLKPVINNLKLFSKNNSNLNARSISTFLGIDNVDTEDIIQITNQDNLSNYIFNIETDFENTGYFENLYLRETEQSIISYIIRYEPNMDWYNANLYLTHDTKYYINMQNYQGDITKYSLEGEVMWSTKSEYASSSRATNSRSSNEFVTLCFISVAPVCSCNTDGHDVDPEGVGCNCISYVSTEVCQSGWTSGGGGTNNDGDDGTTNGGGYEYNDGCEEVTGTLIQDSQPISGIDTGCTTNEDTAVKLFDEDFGRRKECKKIAKLFEDNPTYLQKIQTLATTTNQNHENSLSIHEDDSENQVAGVVGSGGIDLPDYPSKYKFYAHTHDSYGIDGSGSLSVYSMEDLITYAKLAFYNRLDSGTFVAFLATDDGTKYALTINNQDKLVDLLFDYIEAPTTPETVFKFGVNKEKAKNLHYDYYDEKNPNRKLKVDSDNSGTDLIHFLNLLKEGDMGVSVFESTDNFQTFENVTLPNNSSTTIKRKPCN
ncbi:hypothetical protein [Olleya namhaensis]|uniref:hypothetical protein n=1 Tax=Olleya namhaensis TaxID=1144750 RepID=UPI0024911B06|nr:hypothetical protein [Olleya namhaensis]